MDGLDWVKEFSGAVTVSDKQGIIVYMNEKSAKGYGGSLVGNNMLDCHPEPARTTLEKLMDTQAVNTYTIEKKGIKKLIHQAPWFKNGEYAGFVELSIEIPFDMPHFVRTPNPA
jgi:transcriptional regulator with PAS, ATPase and Fis domain